MSREQVSPDALSTQHENALICERLLGYVPCKHPECVGWFHYDGKRCVCGPRQKPHLRTRELPSFTTWAEAGLILEALRSHGLIGELQVLEKEYWFGICWRVSDNYVYDCRKDTGPLAIREAALQYVKVAML